MTDNFLPKGGTEILLDLLLKYCGKDWQQWCDLYLIAPVDTRIQKTHKPSVLWCHLNSDNSNVQGLRDPLILQSFDWFVFVSHNQYADFVRVFGIPPERSVVIKNAIEPIDIKQKSEDKIRLIYTSMPWRGLNVLLDAVELVDRDFEVDVYSSLKIYGSSYEEQTLPEYKALFERAKNQPKVNYWGYASNAHVRQCLQSAHIFAYPSIFSETSCLSAIEAGAAGCSLITTNLGALPETCANFANYVNFSTNHDWLVTEFAKALTDAIDNFWTPATQQKLKTQSEYFNQSFSWDIRKNEWNNFFQRIKHMQPIIQTPSTQVFSSPTKEILSSPPSSERRVLVGTPSYDGKLDVWYVNSLMETIKIGLAANISIKPIWVSYDSLVQRARNDVIYYAKEGNYDDVIMIDADIEWNPEWFFKLLDYPVDVVGGTYPKKDDTNGNIYVVKKTIQTAYDSNGLMKVDGLGTGFLRLSRRAYEHLWNTSKPYTHNNREQRWIFDVTLFNGDIISEDINLCKKLKESGFDIWLDPKMTCNHIGVKKYQGNFEKWFAALPTEEPLASQSQQMVNTQSVTNKGPQRRFR